MVTRKRTKHLDRQPPARKPRALLNDGDWLDVMDLDGVWNVARVLSVPSADEVEITYDGWGDEYDEVLRLDSHRVAPYHTFTSAVKCWVKYLNWPLWPSLITIRAPGTEDGMKNLAAENRLYVDFLDNASFAKRDRCWQMKGKARKFEDNYDKKRTESTGLQFEQALAWVLQSDASTKMPKFARGTLPEEFKFSPAKSVDTVRKNMGDELWFQSFTLSRMRHKMSHAYEMVGDEDDDASSDDSKASATEEKLALPEVKTEPPAKPNKQKQSPPVRIELDLGVHEEVEVPLELEPLSSDNSDGSSDEDEQGGSRPKRRLLRTKRRSDELSTSKKRVQKQARHSASNRIATPRLTGRRSSATKSSSRHAKGQVKMAARRSIPPGGGYLNLSPSNFEPVSTLAEVSHEAISGQVEVASNELEYDDVHQQEDEERDAIADVKMDSIDEKIASVKKVLQELVEERQHATEDTPVNDQAPLVDPSSIPGCDQALFISPSAAKTHQSKPTSSELILSPTRSDEGASLVLSKARRSSKGKAKKSSRGRDVRQEKPDRVVVSVGHSPRSGTVQDTTPSGLEEKEKARSSTSEAPKTGESKRTRSVLPNERDIEHGDDDDDSQEQHGRFCVMQADNGESAEVRSKEKPRVDACEKVKCSKKTVISMPRKFSETPPTQVPTRFSNPMPPMAPPPRFRLSAPTGTALASPSTAVFSSSKGFSMESWFKRKLTRDFLNGGA